MREGTHKKGKLKNYDRAVEEWTPLKSWNPFLIMMLIPNLNQLTFCSNISISENRLAWESIFAPIIPAAFCVLGNSTNRSAGAWLKKVSRNWFSAVISRLSWFVVEIGSVLVLPLQIGWVLCSPGNVDEPLE